MYQVVKVKASKMAIAVSHGSKREGVRETFSGKLSLNLSKVGRSQKWRGVVNSCTTNRTVAVSFL